MEFLQHPTKHLFFTGKGGVGKTSIACASAVRLADEGKNVLLVSTDPASNLDEVLGVILSNTPTAVPSVPRLFAMNLNPQKAAEQYRERMVAPYRGVLPDAAIKSMEEQFSGSCTVEIAAFDEFSRLLGDVSATEKFDHVLFDTAPTGHTLRLLTLPSAWAGFMENNTSGTTCLGPLAGLQPQRDVYRATVAALSNPEKTTLILVARAEPSALREATRTSLELQSLGVTNQHLVINGVFRAAETSDSYALSFQARGEQALAGMAVEMSRLPQTVVPLRASGIGGIECLRSLLCEGGEKREPVVQAIHQKPRLLPPISTLVEDLISHGHGVILTMGKGGVGKTTIAAAVAVEIAARGYPVHLTTTDPAAHLTATIGGSASCNLTITRIDPVAETKKYSLEVMRKAGANLDEAGRSLLEEDLRSPCTEEIAVFRAFADAVAEGEKSFIVLDTAPTGHTILLLDAALAYHREVTRQSNHLPDAVENLLPRLRDPEYTRILIVTLPEATPVHEAAALQSDLRRAEIAPYAWVINQALAPLTLSDPLLLQKQAHEDRYVREVVESHADRAVMVSWQKEPPIGAEKLHALMMSDVSA